MIRPYFIWEAYFQISKDFKHKILCQIALEIVKVYCDLKCLIEELFFKMF